MNHRFHSSLLAVTSLLACLLASLAQASTALPTHPTFIIVAGAPGEEEFRDPITRQVTAWDAAATTLGARRHLIGHPAPGTTPDRAQLEKVLADEPKEGTAQLWIVLIGHGTFDKKEARLNLQGDDLTASDLASWLQPFQRPLAVIHTTSASAPFLAKLSAPGRIIITATRTGNEQNYSRFGSSLATVLSDADADLDQDGQVSLLEAFLAASSKVTEFYKTEGRLATEHALIDDNGDRLGTPAAWFRGLRAVKKSKDAAVLDGPIAHQWHLTIDPADAARPPEWHAQRQSLESALASLREKKPSLAPEEYQNQLESLLLKIARLYEP